MRLLCVTCEVRRGITRPQRDFAALRGLPDELVAMELCLERREAPAARPESTGAWRETAIDLDFEFHRAVVTSQVQRSS